ncbi:MAG: alcohol dehydrogenase catalytic domain-containing protein [Chloroflexi bacterium]|nr:alcohol dehydrogenase catalytic domain-containing protein [Chloroflexota bacterium]
MRAQVFYDAERMELREVPRPPIADDEVLVRVRACGICGSDVSYYWGLSPLETATGKGPLVLGHELTGEVVEVGQTPARLGLLSAGDRVVLNPVQACQACVYCQRGLPNLCLHKTALGVSVDGGFAEYCRVRYTNALKLPASVSFEEGALAEPLACATYAVQNLDVNPGSTCVVVGPGPIGLMMVQLVRASGAGRVMLVGTRDYRLEVGRALGAHVLINVREPASPYYAPDLRARIAELTGGLLADRVITPTASPESMRAALEISGPASRIVYFGLPGPLDRLEVPALETMFADKTIRFSWLAPLTWPTALQALATGLVDVRPLISHRVGLDRLIDALHGVRERRDHALKALVTFK